MEEQDSGELLREYNGLYQSYDDICHDIALAAGMSVTAFQILYYLLENGDGGPYPGGEPGAAAPDRQIPGPLPPKSGAIHQHSEARIGQLL